MLLKEYLGREMEVLTGVANRTDQEIDDAPHEAGLNGTGTKGRTNGYHSRMGFFLMPANFHFPSNIGPLKCHFWSLRIRSSQFIARK